MANEIVYRYFIENEPNLPNMPEKIKVRYTQAASDTTPENISFTGPFVTTVDVSPSTSAWVNQGYYGGSDVYSTLTYDDLSQCIDNTAYFPIRIRTGNRWLALVMVIESWNDNDHTRQLYFSWKIADDIDITQNVTVLSSDYTSTLVSKPVSPDLAYFTVIGSYFCELDFSEYGGGFTEEDDDYMLCTIVASYQYQTAPLGADDPLLRRGYRHDVLLEPQNQARIFYGWTYTDASPTPLETPYAKTVSFYQLRTTYGGGEINIDEESQAGPPSEEDGYTDPSFDDSSDTIELPSDPAVGVANVGFVNVYKTGVNSLQNMGLELFPDLQYTAPQAITGNDTTDAIVNGFNELVTFFANIPSFFEQTNAGTLINYILDCHVIPVTPTGGTAEYIKVGYKTLTCSGYKLSNDYVTFNCGTISLAEYYANFADFLTNAKLFLPFIGFVPARPEWFYRDSLTVKYRFNVVDGSFVAFVMSTGSYVNNSNQGPTIVGQYGGSACVHLPITGLTYANMVSGLIGAASGAVVSAASGNVAGVATSAINAANLRGDIPQSNTYSASSSFLTSRCPYLLIERPVSNFSKTYPREIGIPSNISVKLSSVHGFATVGNIHLDGITATDQEKSELERLLREGVIF